MVVVKIIGIILGCLIVAGVLGVSVYFAIPKFKEAWSNLDEAQLKSKKISFFITIALVVVLAIIAVTTGITFSKFYHYDAYFSTEKVTNIQYFKEYCGNLDGTIAGDTEIYIIAGSNIQFDANGRIIEPEKHPSLLILGGTHPNEPAGQLAATVILENATVGPDTILFVITEANKSGYSHSHPQEASPFYYHLTTATGATREFKFGSRAANSVDQWPNPDVYTTLKGTKLSTNDARNLNRSYPGDPDGTYSEQMAYAIAELIRQNDIKMEIDLHEASPEYLTINAIVYHERADVIAANSLFDLNGYGINIEINPSPMALRGLTHRELGDATNTIALLCETSNSAQGKIRGKFVEELILDGMIDKFYEKAVEITEANKVDKSVGAKIIYGTPTTMGERVGRHVQSVLSMIAGYNGEVDDLGFENQTWVYDDPKYSGSSKTRQQTLIDCGYLEVEVDLTTHLNDAAMKTEVNKLQTSFGKQKGAYGALLKYGVGYFLADPQN